MRFLPERSECLFEFLILQRFESPFGLCGLFLEEFLQCFALESELVCESLRLCLRASEGLLERFLRLLDRFLSSFLSFRLLGLLRFRLLGLLGLLALGLFALRLL